jgi:hypothetical protein
MTQDRSKLDWMCTYTGLQYYPAAPRADEVCIEDIAHALSMLCRYTGHCREFYSVAEHSVLVSQVVPIEYALIGLLHDATEAYCNDINRPLKRSLPDYNRIEALNWAAIAEKFELPVDIPDEVHAADWAVLRTEAEDLMPKTTRQWGFQQPAADVVILALNPEWAKLLFLNRFRKLTGT